MSAKGQKTETSTVNDELPVAGTELPMAAGRVAMQAWMEVGTEAVRFVWDRLQQDIKTQNAILGCSSLEEMQKIQAEFFRDAQEQYAAEARKMLGILGKAATAGLTASAQARRYNDVPL